jgi:hypothetical protein
MGTPTTWSDCSRSSAALERIELMVGTGANRMRAFTFHSIRASGTRRLSPYSRLRETHTARDGSLPPPQTIHFVPLRVSSDVPQAASLKFSWTSVLNSATAGPLAGGVRSVPP